jgi:hypothetical protein
MSRILRWLIPELLPTIVGYLVFAVIFVLITAGLSFMFGKEFFQNQSKEIISALQAQQPSQLLSRFLEIQDVSFRCPSPALESFSDQPRSGPNPECSLSFEIQGQPIFIGRWPMAFWTLAEEQVGQIFDRPTQTVVNIIQLVLCCFLGIRMASSFFKDDDKKLILHPSVFGLFASLGLIATTFLACPTEFIISRAAWLISVFIPSVQDRATVGTYAGLVSYCSVRIGEKFFEVSFEGLVKSLFSGR